MKTPQLPQLPHLNVIEDTKAWVLALRRLLLPRGMEDIPLLPSTAHVMLVALAALVGLLAGLVATFLRTAVHLMSGVFLVPHELLALALDADSAVRARFHQGLSVTAWNAGFGVGALTCTAFLRLGFTGNGCVPNRSPPKTAQRRGRYPLESRFSHCAGAHGRPLFYLNFPAEERGRGFLTSEAFWGPCRSRPFGRWL